jgi:hypothetical protein
MEKFPKGDQPERSDQEDAEPLSPATDEVEEWTWTLEGMIKQEQEELWGWPGLFDEGFKPDASDDHPFGSDHPESPPPDSPPPEVPHKPNA